MTKTLAQSTPSLLYGAAELMTSLTGWPVEVEPCAEVVTNTGQRIAVDGLMHIHRTPSEQFDFTLVAYNRTLDAHGLFQVFFNVAAFQPDLQPPLLVLSPYIPPGQAEVLRKDSISHMDLTGTVYLNQPNLLVWFGRAVRGLKKKSLLSAMQMKSESLTLTGVRLIYFLLTDPSRVQLPFRQLAALAGVSLGGVKAAIDYLQQYDFIRIPRKNERVLVRRRELLDKWVEGYQQRLRPKLLIGRYVALKSGPGPQRTVEFCESLDIPPAQASWSGEAAAIRLLNGYQLFQKTIYLHARNQLNLMLARNRLERNADGDVEILTSFWPKEDEIREGIAPPLIIYADLILSNSSRCWEAAAEIYNHYLKARIEHDS